jgi:site-specific DNA recombinase
MRAVIYCRISQDDGTALGVARQEAACRDAVSSRGWTVEAVHTDNNVSASSGAARPGWQATLALLVAGEADALISYAIDRWSRDADELAGLCRTARALGVSLTTITGGDVDVVSATGKFRARVDAGVAALETDRLLERQRAKMVELAKAGKPHGGVRAYGFKDKILDDGRVKRTTEHEPHEVAVIREVTDALLSGVSLRGQCLKLNARGDLGVRGSQWEPSTMKRMLLNPRLIGRREHHGELSDATWEAVITREQQIALKAILTGRHRGAPHRHLLSGVTYCGSCGAKVRFTGQTRGNAPTYHCPPRPRGKNCLSMVADAFERHVVAEVLRYYGEDRERQPAAVTGDPTARDRERLVAVQAAYLRDDLDLDDYLRFKAELQARINETAARAAAEAEGAALAERTATLASRWPDLTDEEKRVAVQHAVSRIVLHPKTSETRIEIEWPPYQGPLTLVRTGRSGLTDAEVLAVGAEMQREQRGVER